MNKNEKIAVAIILSSIVMLNWYNNNRLRKEINLLKNDIGNINSNIVGYLNDLNYSIGNFQEEIRGELETQSSILSSHNIDMEYEAGRMNIKLAAVPKEFNGDEEVKFIIGNEEFTAINEGGVFVAKCIASPKETIEAKIQFINGDIIRQEELTPFNIGEQLAIDINVFTANSIQESEEKRGEYEDTLILTCYDTNGKAKLKEPKEITFIVKDISKEKIIAEKPMEHPPAEIIDIPKLEPHDMKTSFFSVDISDIIELKGQYVMYCDLVTENGIRYYFPMGEFENNGQFSSNNWGANSGPIYPIFD